MKNYIRTSIPAEFAKTTGLKKDVFFFFDDADSWHRTQAYEFLMYEVELKTDFGLQIHFGAACTLTVPTKETIRRRYARRRKQSCG